MHESLAFDLAEPTTVDGIPVTGVARTILDCAPAEEKPIRLLDDALRRSEPPVMARIRDDRLLLDCRTVLPAQIDALARVLSRL